MFFKQRRLDNGHARIARLEVERDAAHRPPELVESLRVETRRLADKDAPPRGRERDARETPGALGEERAVRASSGRESSLRVDAGVKRESPDDVGRARDGLVDGVAAGAVAARAV